MPFAFTMYTTMGGEWCAKGTEKDGSMALRCPTTGSCSSYLQLCRRCWGAGGPEAKSASIYCLVSGQEEGSSTAVGVYLYMESGLGDSGRGIAR